MLQNWYCEWWQPTRVTLDSLELRFNAVVTLVRLKSCRANSYVKYSLASAWTTSHPVTTPLENSNHLVPATENDLFKDASLYRATIGLLMYAAIGTRPNLTFSVQKLAQFSHAPSKKHWKAVKHVLHYVKGTLDLGITTMC